MTTRAFLTHLIYWLSMGLILYLFRWVGLEENPYVSIDLGQERGALFLSVMLFSCFIGIASWMINGIIDRRIRDFSYGFHVLVKSGSLFIMVIVCFLALVLVRENLLFHILKPAREIGIRDTILSKTMLLAILFVALGSILYNTFTVVNKKFGKGQLFKIMLGKYHRPLEEERIFLFLDLRHSTNIAENIGHVAFSALIQDLFMDLNRVFYRSSAEIYQYLGDGVIVSWQISMGNYFESVRLYFDYLERLKSRADYYKVTYGIQPEFKAGIHVGMAVAAEVGEIKKEISYNGDAVNVTARLQEKCKEFDAVLATSGAFSEKIRELNLPFTTTYLGNYELKGKEKEQAIYSLELGDGV